MLQAGGLESVTVSKNAVAAFRELQSGSCLVEMQKSIPRMSACRAAIKSEQPFNVLQPEDSFISFPFMQKRA